MERIKKLPLYRRFGFRIFFFNSLLLYCVILPMLSLKDIDYKGFVDRNDFQRNLFEYGRKRLKELNEEDWEEELDRFPGVLYQQRIHLFSIHGESLYDSGVMSSRDYPDHLRPLLPSPYITWTDQQEPLDLSYQVDFLNKWDLPENTRDRWFYHKVGNLSYPEGMDRVTFIAARVQSADDQEKIFVICSSAADILSFKRALKERYLFLILFTGLIGLLLAIALSWTITIPFRQLHQYSQQILKHGRIEKEADKPLWGEMGEILSTFKKQMQEQQRRTQEFHHFSSDVVHELKTPLTAIRTGLELYSQSETEEEKEQLFHRLNRKIMQMEALMNQIENLGKLEGTSREDWTLDLPKLLQDLSMEFPHLSIENQLSPERVEIPLELSSQSLYQVLSNLIQNGLSFSPQGSPINLIITEEEDHWIFQVNDQGPGIPPEVIDQITGRFFSYRQKDQKEHSGLGLAIVKTLMDRCGGTLEYGNLSHRGAFFRCRIPK